jgi:hypothetical protein
MAKTIHVYPSNGEWTVRRVVSESGKVFKTQKEAIDEARRTSKRMAPSQVAVHGKDGTIKAHFTYGFPRVQDPRVKGPHAKQIEKAVSRLALERFESDPCPARG